MFLWVTLPEGVSAMALFPKALEKKVAFVPGDPFYIGIQNVNTMRLNYTNADCETIAEGIYRLGDLLKKLSVMDFSKAERKKIANTEDVLAISEQLIKQNKEAYEVLAK